MASSAATATTPCTTLRRLPASRWGRKKCKGVRLQAGPKLEAACSFMCLSIRHEKRHKSTVRIMAQNW